MIIVVKKMNVMIIVVKKFLLVKFRKNFAA